MDEKKTIDNIMNLQAENEKLRWAIVEISRHMDEINKILAEVGEIIIEEENKSVTEDDVKNLLKKYSTL